MDTPNISGAKTTTTAANLAGGWYTTLFERTKRSTHSWAMIPFTEPNYSVPDGSSRKVGEANVPTIFSLDITGSGRTHGDPPHLMGYIRSQTLGGTRMPRREVQFDETLQYLGEELVRYLATGMSVAHMPETDRRERLINIAGEGGNLDFCDWMSLNGQMVAEIRHHEWGSGGPVHWLRQRYQTQSNRNTIWRVGDFPEQPGIIGPALKAPVLCLYMVDGEYVDMLNQRAVGASDDWQFGRPINNNDGIVSGTGLQIVFALNVEDAGKMVSSDPFGNTIAVYAHNRDCHVLCHPMMQQQYAYRLRHVLEGMGAARPSLNYIGLGHVTESGSVQRPSLGWSVGQLAYNGRNYRADGSCYIPSDYFPYSMLKRTAKFNHVITQVGQVWMRGLGAYGPGDDDQRINVGPYNGALPSMVQLLWGEQFGYTTTPSIATEPFFDAESVAQRVDEYLIQGFGSGVLGLDAGTFLAAPLNFLNAYQEEAETAMQQIVGDNLAGGYDDTFVIALTDFDGEILANAPANAGEACNSLVTFGCQQALENVWATVKAALGPLFQVPLTPMTMLHSGGPRPGHVVERLQMNFRPDISVSGGSAGSKPYFLMPTEMNPGQTLNRIPTLIDVRAESAADTPNIWLGPRDPTVLTGVETVHYDGDRPREVTDPDYALESPVIMRDATAGSFELNGRPVSLRVYPRPAYHRLGYNLVGVFNTLTHGIESASGNYFLYPEDLDHFEAGNSRGGLLSLTGANVVEQARIGSGDGNVNMANRRDEKVGPNGGTRLKARDNFATQGLPAENNSQSLGGDGGAIEAPIDIGGLGGLNAAVQVLEDDGDVE